MTIKIHHNTAKKAAAHKIVLTVQEGEVVASTKDGVKLAQGLMGNKVLDDAIVKLGAPVVKARAEAKVRLEASFADMEREDAEDIADLEAGGKGTDAASQAFFEKPRKAKKVKVAKKPAKKVKRVVEDDEELAEGDEADGDEPEEGRSMIKAKYKKVYKPFKMTNGDDLNQLLAQHLKYKDEDGKLRVNKAKLVAFAKANDCWVDDYKHLNIGQQRLNVGNRLRAKIKHGHKVVWS